MKMSKKMIFSTVLFVFFLGSLLPSTLHASRVWYTCTVVSAGVADGYIAITLTDDGRAFSRKTFNISGDETTENRFLATALTAISAGMKLMIFVDLSAGSQITHMYVKD
jgi:hypothetical protein